MGLPWCTFTSADEKETIEKAVQETLDWVDENQEAEAEDFKEKQKEIGAWAVPCRVSPLLLLALFCVQCQPAPHPLHPHSPVTKR